MHSALVIIERESQVSLPHGFLDRVESDTRIAPISTRLCHGVWLCTLADGLNGLSALIQSIADEKYPYRVLFFDEAPAWIHSPHEFQTGVKRT